MPEARDHLNPSCKLSLPFTSPDFNDARSVRSVQSGHTPMSCRLYESPYTSTTALTDYESGGTSDHDEWHLERYSQDTKVQKASHVGAQSDRSRRRPRPGLHIVTNIANSSLRSHQVIFDQVHAKQAETRRNQAQSVVSQTGVNFGIETPKTDQRNALASLKGLFQNKSQKRRGIVQPAVETSPKNELWSPGTTASHSSIVIGLCVPKEDMKVPKRGEYYDNVMTLHTPVTPAIIITPPIEKFVRGKDAELTSTMFRGRSAHSPNFPLSGVSTHRTLMNHNPFRKTTKASPISVSENEIDTPQSVTALRRRSDGWWNLALSPMLSRAGSVLSRKGREHEDLAPPVPAIPADFEKQLSAVTMTSDLSPETPRRAGLASPQGSTWTEWTEMSSDCESKADAAATDDSACEKIFPIRMSCEQIEEGLAAEYFHASAIEQLAGIGYFECINHSCAESWPKLKSIHDSKSVFTHVPDLKAITSVKESSYSETSKITCTRGLAILGTPLDGNGSAAATSATIARALDKEIQSTSRGSKPLSRTATKALMTPVESDSEPDEFSPNVRKANTAAVVRARAFISTPRSFEPPSHTRTSAVVAPLTTAVNVTDKATIPGPVVVGKTAIPSDESLAAPNVPVPEHDAMSVPFGRSMAPASDLASTQPLPQHIHLSSPGHVSNAQLHKQQPPCQVAYPRQSAAHHVPSQLFFCGGQTQFRAGKENPATSHKCENSPTRRVFERVSDVATTKKSDPKRFWQYWPRQKKVTKSGTLDDKKKKKRKQKRCCLIVLLLLLLLLAIIAACIALAIKLGHKTGGGVTDDRWLNLTGYPPMPTGVSSIAQPDLARSESGCVVPSTLWSCSLPKEEHATVAPNSPNQPNFRFAIKFRNGTTPANMTMALSMREVESSNDVFSANPAAPNQADQAFLGQTTDNVTAPFDGEATPFYISFMSSNAAVSSSSATRRRVVRRQGQLNLDDNIPPPAISDDGTAAPASLLPANPYPVDQSIKLYNRGLQDEHYGFYMYYDKSIFLSGFDFSNGNVSGSLTPIAADQDGGSTKSTASVRCTWQQTRFLVKMYTGATFDAVLLDRRANTTADDGNSEHNAINDFARPGSFPYPTTIMIDRHGGSINSKITFCYGMRGERININDRTLVFENRTFAGTLVNPAPAFLRDNNSTSSSDRTTVGIDGGTGGCGCSWQNWR